MSTTSINVDLTDPSKIYIYHITDVSNLNSIIAQGGLKSDAALATQQATGQVNGIGYSHIKTRRLTQTKVDCCNGRFVGEFVPFYFCPRSPMLYTVNRGNTGKTIGSQATIVHLVSSMTIGMSQNRDWAFSDVSAATGYPNFFNDPKDLNQLDWEAIKSTNWSGKSTQKQAEFLVADHFDWSGVLGIGCMTPVVTSQVQQIIGQSTHLPVVKTKPNWYY